jgi:deoxyhypusine monooxygenase
MDAFDSTEVTNRRMVTLREMEQQFDNRNEIYFMRLLQHHDMIIRTRAVCILADISSESVVNEISMVLKTDSEPLVRHEAAFSLGQLGFASAIESLIYAVKSDPSFFVRHEAAIALGVIGSEGARNALNEALSDGSEEVRKSAKIALANLDYVSIVGKAIHKENKFLRLTGG